MTLGGLALAVGILVDDATVTIENMNWHLEQGKPIERAILDGAQQIVVPATVSLLCICVAFVPMFGLGGVAGYLFRPLAEAVVFAMIGSYMLSRTLVPTMAHFLLRGQTHGHAVHGEGDAAPRRSRNPFVWVQQGFERGFEAIRQRYVGLLHLGLRKRGLADPRFSRRRRGCRSASRRSSARTSSRTSTPARSSCMCAGRPACASRARPRWPRHIETEVRERSSRRASCASVVANIGLPISGINIAYGNSGTIGSEDADLLITLNEDHQPTEGYVRELRKQLPELFPGRDLLVPARRHRLADPELRLAGADRRADRRARISRANRAFANKMLARMKGVPGLADGRVQQAFQAADAQRRLRPHAWRASSASTSRARRPACCRRSPARARPTRSTG